MTSAPRPMRRAKRLSIQLAGWLALVLIRPLAWTYRFRVFGAEARARAEAQHPNGSFCLALWHEHLFATILAHRRQRVAPLASLSADGDIVTFVMERLGYQTIRGSSSRRGEQARQELVDASREGWITAITMDGPRGPRRRVKGGVVDVARRGGGAILPVVVMGARTWTLTRSWDQFKIPKPFTRVAIRYGTPVLVAPDTHGLAFGAVKANIKAAMAAAESKAFEDLATWNEPLDRPV